MTKRRPKTGEPRETKQPLKIDRLPPAVHRAIEDLRNKHGLSWQAIEDLSAEPFGQRWDDKVEEDEEGNVSVTTPPFKVHPARGFVAWGNLPLAVLELFPDMRLPHTNLARWYDLRISQVQQDVRARSENARVIATSFAKSVVKGDKEAVVNACRDQLMAVLSEDGTAAGKMRATKALLGLAEVMQAARANDIKERKVAADERKIALLEQKERLAITKLEAETEKLTKKASSGQPITADDLADIRKKTFGF